CFVICFNLFFCFSEKRLASHFFCFSLSSLYTNQSISPTIIFLKVCNNCLSPPSKVFSYSLLGLAFLLLLFACCVLFFFGLLFLSLLLFFLSLFFLSFSLFFFSCPVFFFLRLCSFLFFLPFSSLRRPPLYFSPPSSASPSLRAYPFSHQIPRVGSCS